MSEESKVAPVGTAYTDLIESYKSEIEQARSRGQGSSLHSASKWDGMGKVYQRAGDLSNAERCLEEAVRIYDGYPVKDSNMRDTIARLAFVKTTMGKKQEADALQQRYPYSIRRPH